MRQLKLEKQQFDIDGFINGTFSFLKEQMNEDVDLSTMIFRVNNIGGVPEFAEEENRDIKKDLDQGLMLLFELAPFSVHRMTRFKVETYSPGSFSNLLLLCPTDH